MDIAIVIVVVVAAFVFIMLISSCFRGLKKAHQMQVQNQELLRRRQAYYMSQANRNSQTRPDGRVVRVATINNSSVAYEIYEIQLPGNTRQLPTVHQPQNRVSSSGNPNRPSRHGRRSRHPAPQPAEVLTPPPPFRQALEESVPVDRSYSQSVNLEEPPPSYDEYLKFHSSGENLVPPSTEDSKIRY